METMPFIWSEWRDSNSRPLRPERSTLPAELHPENTKQFAFVQTAVCVLVAELGFEPRQTESESAVLPLHNSAPVKKRTLLYYSISGGIVNNILRF